MIKGESTEVYNINLIPEREESENFSEHSGSTKESKSYGVTTHDLSIGEEFKEHEIKSIQNQNFSKSTSSRSDSSSDLPDDVKGKNYFLLTNSWNFLELISKPENVKVDEDQNAAYSTNSIFESDRKIGSQLLFFFLKIFNFFFKKDFLSHKIDRNGRSQNWRKKIIDCARPKTPSMWLKMIYSKNSKKFQVDTQWLNSNLNRQNGIKVRRRFF